MIPGPAGRSQSTSAAVYALSSGNCHVSILAPFQSSSWIALSQALDIPLVHQLTLDNSTSSETQSLNMLAKAVKRVVGCTIYDVLDGALDWKVPCLVAVIETIKHTRHGMWTIQLRDPSGTIIGYLLPDIAEAFEVSGLMTSGSSVVLQKVSISYDKLSDSRYLNIHESAIMTVFKACNDACSNSNSVFLDVGTSHPQEIPMFSTYSSATSQPSLKRNID